MSTLKLKLQPMMHTEKGNSYWDGNGAYQKEYEKMCNDLIPQVGFALDVVSRYFGVHIGWLNIKFECHAYFWKTINNNKIKVK